MGLIMAIMAVRPRCNLAGVIAKFIFDSVDLQAADKGREVHNAGQNFI